MTQGLDLKKPREIAARQRRHLAGLAPFLDDVYRRYHHPEFLSTDPLALAHEWADPSDREVVALVAALLAYGQVGQAVASARRVLERLDHRPSEVLAESDFGDLVERFATWRHRVTPGPTLAALLWLVGEARRQTSGGLQSLGLRSDSLSGSDCIGLLSQWREVLVVPGLSHRSLRAHINHRSFRHLLPDPGRGSACKRLLLFLRWMVRPADGVDLGLWNQPDSPWRPSRLLMPVDTHVLRIAGNLGLIPRTSVPNLATSRRLTDMLRLADPEDPTRWDFSLCRLGILQACPTRERLSACAQCALQPACLRHKTLARST